MNKPGKQDAEFCGRVPLHQTNLIQPHGVLLVVTKEELSIVQASENAAAILGRSIKEIVSSTLCNYISPVEAKSLQGLFAHGASGKLPFVFELAGLTHLSVVHQQEDFFIVEIEKEGRPKGEDRSFLSVYQQVKYIMASIDAAATTEATANVVASELKKLSGFDKVMVYRFDEEWNGDVIAEAAELGMELYMGLKFPASDIPKQARELYKKAPYRLIPTIDYEPVRLYPVINPVTKVFTNLADSNLRSVAGVHLEYLRNMKVNASMSTRILKDGELWGLVACHHRTPYYLSYEMCSVFELLSGVITAKISAVQSRDLLAYTAEKQAAETGFTQSLYAHGGAAAYKDSLLQLLEADGIAITMDNHIETAGSTPSAAEISDLVVWLQSNKVTEPYQQTSLCSVYEEAENYSGISSGLLALPVESGRGNFVLAFRAGAEQKIAWGGNPAEALQFESDGKKYHPRASFKIWQQTVKYTSLPWGPGILQTAERVRNLLIAYGLNKN